jgi:hypothetical protein
VQPIPESALQQTASYQARPDLWLNLNVMFVARFKKYEQALAQLSRIVTFFQRKRIRI